MVPSYAKDSSQLSQVEAVECPLWRNICSPAFTTVHQHAHHTSPAYSNFRINFKLAVQFTYDSSCFFPIILLISVFRFKILVTVLPRYVKLVTVPSLSSPNEIIGFCLTPCDIFLVFSGLFLVQNNSSPERMHQLRFAGHTRCVTQGQHRQQR